MLKLKLQYFGHLMWRTDSFGKTLMLGKIEGRRRRGQQRMRWLDGITKSLMLLNWVWASSGRRWRTGKPGVLQSMGLQRVGHDWAIEKQPMYKTYPESYLANVEIVSKMPSWPPVGSRCFYGRDWRPGVRRPCIDVLTVFFTLWDAGKATWHHYSAGSHLQNGTMASCCHVTAEMIKKNRTYRSLDSLGERSLHLALGSLPTWDP